MGMLRVDPVADREEGLWSAARDDHGAWPRPQNRARTDRKSLVKYVDLFLAVCGLVTNHGHGKILTPFTDRTIVTVGTFKHVAIEYKAVL